MRYLHFKNESNKNVFYAKVFEPKFKNITNFSNISYVTRRNFLIFIIRRTGEEKVLRICSTAQEMNFFIKDFFFAGAKTGVNCNKQNERDINVGKGSSYDKIITNNQ